MVIVQERFAYHHAQGLPSNRPPPPEPPLILKVCPVEGPISK